MRADDADIWHKQCCASNIVRTMAKTTVANREGSTTAKTDNGERRRYKGMADDADQLPQRTDKDGEWWMWEKSLMEHIDTRC